MHGPNRKDTIQTTAAGQQTRAGGAVLIFTPTWEVSPGQYAIEPECKAAIEAQDYADFEWWESIDNPYPVPDHRNVLHQYQQARAEFLAGEWSALLTVEHDNVLPDSGAVGRLMDTPGDIVYAPYVLRHGAPLLNTWQYIGNRRAGDSLTKHPDELAKARAKNIWRVSGIGMGCTLFRRHVLEALKFRESSSLNPCPDLSFADDALRVGFVSYARFDVPVLHIEGARDGHAARRLHPFEIEPKKAYTALVSKWVIVIEREVKLTSGKMVELDEREAEKLMKVGYVGAITQTLTPALSQMEREL